MDFTVTITDQAQLDGITWAREQHNVSAEAIKGDGAEYSIDAPYFDDDAAYVQWVMDNASKSYAQQKAHSDAMEAAGA